MLQDQLDEAREELRNAQGEIRRMRRLERKPCAGDMSMRGLCAIDKGS